MNSPVWDANLIDGQRRLPGLRLGRGEAGVDVGEGGGEGGDVGLEDGDAGLDFGLQGHFFEGRFAEQVVDGGADHGRDAAVTAHGAELTETFVFVVSEAEADHSAA